MYLITVFLPLIGFLNCGIFGKNIGYKGSCIITTSCITISLAASLIIFYEVGLSECPVYIKLLPWINSEFLNVDWGFMFDSLTVIMCVIILFISFIVHIYSIEYMAKDPHLTRFMSYLSLFTFFMLFLVTSDNFVQLFLGWEGVGLCSFLLINFWFTRIQANKAAIKAMIVNRISDLGLILAILTIFVTFKAVDYSTVFSLVPLYINENILFFNYELKTIDVIGIFLLISSVGKSAQLGLHTWLPDAMEGPTPVSALIHAATMVTAGVFLIVRCSPILEYSNITLNLLVIIGGSTAFFGSTVALFQNDIKKIIAYSTCSQLGYMVFSCGLSNYTFAIFHLINHAFFKALLFLCAGSVIHAIFNEQDIRKMGGLKNLIPFTYSAMVIGTMSLLGFPFLTGFYSKEIILESAWGNFTNYSHFCYFLGIISVFTTSLYSTRLIYLVFLTNPNGYKKVLCKAKEPFFLMTVSMLILIIPSVIFGYFASEIFLGTGTTFWGSSIFVNINNFTNNNVDSEYINKFVKILPIFLNLVSIFFVFVIYKFFKLQLYILYKNKILKLLYNFFNRKWFFDKVYNEFFNQQIFKFGYTVTYKKLDKGLFQITGPKSIMLFINNLSKSVNNLQSGFMYHYIFVFLFGSSFILSFKQYWQIFENYLYLDYRLTFVFLVAIIIFNKYDSNFTN